MKNLFCLNQTVSLFLKICKDLIYSFTKSSSSKEISMRSCQKNMINWKKNTTKWFPQKLNVWRTTYPKIKNNLDIILHLLMSKIKSIPTTLLAKITLEEATRCRQSKIMEGNLSQWRVWTTTLATSIETPLITQLSHPTVSEHSSTLMRWQIKLRDLIFKNQSFTEFIQQSSLIRFRTRFHSSFCMLVYSSFISVLHSSAQSEKNCLRLTK